MDETLTIEFDGGSRGNPGPAGTGSVVRAADGTVLRTIGNFVGRATNNVAEYKALITGLEQARLLGARRVIVRGDSELIIKQMRGEYRVKNPDMKILHERAMALVDEFEKVQFTHNLRHHNELADKLANLAMDRRATVEDVDDVADSGTAIEPRGPVPQGPSQPELFASRPTTQATPLRDPVTRPGRFACDHCGAKIQIVSPSTQISVRSRPFVCQCGKEMRAE